MIFGGGQVALRKIKTLLKYHARIEVISQDVIAEIRELLPEQQIHRIDADSASQAAETWSQPADPGSQPADPRIQDAGSDRVDHEIIADKSVPEREIKDEIIYWLEQADLVIAATSSRSFNHAISSWCHEHDILVNVIDAPSECSFLFPSVVKKGEISIGINTGARSPIVSKQVRKDIEEAVPDYYAEIADQLGRVRSFVKEEFGAEEIRRKILKQVAVDAFSEKRILTAAELKEIYGQYMDR